MELTNNQNRTFLLPMLPQWVVWAIKRSIFCAAWGYILYRFAFDDALSFEQFGTIDTTVAFYLQLLLVIFFMLANWSIESLKWKMAVSGFYPLGFAKAFRGVLFGLSVAIFTPNRSGEYFGRIWVIPNHARVKSILATIFANSMQLAVTLIFGAISLFMWQINNKLPFGINHQKMEVYLLAIVLIAALFVAILILFWKRTEILKTPVSAMLKEVRQTWSLNLVFQLWGLSFLRYLVFMVQFWILLKLCNAPVPFMETFYGIGIMYLVMALIPVLTFAEPAVRSTLSVLFLSVYSSNEAGIVCASIFMWIINLAIPALAGAVLLNSYKTREND
jgi:hypothetical protein